MYIVFDTETTGRAKNFSAPVNDFNNWPRMVQIAWKVFDKNGVEIDSKNHIIKPQGFIIPEEVVKIHRISTQRAKEEGIPLRQALEEFAEAVKGSKYLIAHNIPFDENVVGCEYLREGMHNHVQDIMHVDTMKLTTEYVAIPNKRRGGFKYPSLTELHTKLFGKGFDDAHDAMVDVDALAKCFFKLQEIGVLGYKESDEEIAPESLSDFAEEESSEETQEPQSQTPLNFEREEQVDTVENSLPLVPLGLHTFHSVLDGAGSVDDYIKMAKAYGHNAVAITDNSTLSGAFEFFQKCSASGVKPIFGIEILLNDNVGKFEDRSLEGDNYKMKILVKNEQGYKSLNKLIYLSNTEGYYNKSARITTKWLLENKEGLIVSTSGLESKLAHTVLRGKNQEAENYLNMLRTEFGDDLIVELQFSKFPTQKQYNNFLIKMVKKYRITPVLSNDTYYPRAKDSIIQDVVTSIKQHRPMHMCRLKENRELYYFNSEDFRKMNQKYGFNYPDNFIDLCLSNTLKIADKCNFELELGEEKYPKYEPTEDVINYFGTDKTEDIIVKLAFAKLKQKINKYKETGIVEITDEKIKEYVDRLNYELSVIESKKMLDYFLVNWEIINFYRKQGDDAIPNYDIGPARGCFVPGSRVKMADGMYAPIDTIEIGDKVIDAFGDEREVIDTLEYDIEEDIIELEFDDGRMIECTLDHEILTENRGWVQAKDLTEEDEIIDINNIDMKEKTGEVCDNGMCNMLNQTKPHLIPEDGSKMGMGFFVQENSNPEQKGVYHGRKYEKIKVEDISYDDTVRKGENGKYKSFLWIPYGVEITWAGGVKAVCEPGMFDNEN